MFCAIIFLSDPFQTKALYYLSKFFSDNVNTRRKKFVEKCLTQSRAFLLTVHSVVHISIFQNVTK